MGWFDRWGYDPLKMLRDAEHAEGMIHESEGRDLQVAETGAYLGGDEAMVGQG